MKKALRSLATLLMQLADDERRRLKHFSISAVVFFVAYSMLHWVNTELPSSIEQELYALLLIAICGLAFIYAIGLQLIFIFSKTIK